MTEAEWTHEGEPVLRQVLAPGSVRRFTDAVPHRLVLFPWFNPPSPTAVEAVAKAARAVGDSSSYRVFDIPQPSQYSWIPLDDLEGFLPAHNEPLSHQYCLVSGSGKWAIVSSDFDDAFVAASERTFIETLAKALDEADEAWSPYVISKAGDARREQVRWRLEKPLPAEGQVAAWISRDRFLFPDKKASLKEDLVHLYGERRAAKLLQAYRESSLKES